MNSMRTITLAFATMGARLETLLPLLRKLQHIEEIELLVVVQKWDDKHVALSSALDFVKFVWEDSIGLSRSRNKAFDVAAGLYVWTLDDDVDIGEKDVIKLVTTIKSLKEAAEIIRVKVGCIENREHSYKNYSSISEVRRLNLLQMNSIELLVKNAFFHEKNLAFNPKIGLGTSYPGNEEIHFLIDAFENGARFNLLDDVFVYHSCEEGGRRKTESLNIMEIRGATASRYGLVGVLLLARWCLRYTLRDKSIAVLKSLCIGYAKGYEAYR